MMDKTVEKTFVRLAATAFKKSVQPSLSCAKRCGNMHTASLYGGLASVLANVEPRNLIGKRVAMYAFGGGSAGSFYSIRVRGDTTEIRAKMDLLNRLQSMKVVSCQEYVDALKVCTLLSSHHGLSSSIHSSGSGTITLNHTYLLAH
jgi:hydroxymethylglutaryl-CoA synthase